MKRRSLALPVVSVLLVLTTPAPASQEDEQWQPLIGFKYNPPVEDAQKGFILEEAAVNATSFLFGEEGMWNQDFERYICTSRQSANCLDADTFAYSSILPTSKTKTSSWVNYRLKDYPDESSMKLVPKTHQYV
jgi:hypothetical protein